jgi:transcriptional regulator with XRE-family HTH domain
VLHEVMLNTGTSQSELSRLSGVWQPSISQFLSGKGWRDRLVKVQNANPAESVSALLRAGLVDSDGLQRPLTTGARMVPAGAAYRSTTSCPADRTTSG